jgi:hypothetical protein
VPVEPASVSWASLEELRGKLGEVLDEHELMQSLSASGVLSPGQIESIASRWREMTELPPDTDVTQPIDFSLVEEVVREHR